MQYAFDGISCHNFVCGPWSQVCSRLQTMKNTLFMLHLKGYPQRHVLTEERVLGAQAVSQAQPRWHADFSMGDGH